MEKKRILVSVDGSGHSDKVVQKAIDYVKLLDCEIVLVYCHKKFPVLLGQPYRDKVITSIIDESEKLVAPYQQKLDQAEVAYETRLMEEPAGEMITEIAMIEKCDLIIMGSRGLTNLASLIVGSVTNRVLQTAPCSVLVVK